MTIENREEYYKTRIENFAWIQKQDAKKIEALEREVAHWKARFENAAQCLRQDANQIEALTARLEAFDVPEVRV